MNLAMDEEVSEGLLAIDEPCASSSVFSHFHTRMQTRTFTNFWSIEQFSLQQELHPFGESITGQTFGDDSYEFLLKIFPNGKDEDNVGYISLFLQINRCPQPRLQFRVKFTIETLDGPRNCALNKSVVTINRSGIVTASKFFNITTLNNCAERFIPNDVLTIGADLTVFGETQTVTNQDCDATCQMFDRKILRAKNSPTKPLSESLIHLYESGDFSDFVITAKNGHSFSVHKCVLSSRSDYFNALLKSDTKESAEGRVVFKDISVEVMEVIIRHLYSPLTVFKPEDMTHELMIAADRLMLDSLKTQCTKTLKEGITMSNIVARLQLADLLRSDSLFSKLSSFFLKYKKEIQDSQEWKEMKDSNPEVAARVLEAALAFYNSPPNYCKRFKPCFS
ncbi:unnamed protein product [Caenorhabditis auriculariae]|uniref:BTB domain-containing protein n=1 Tax=Caenorhabditis auriculariae TaxID=2777116 RepID=A0A8S1GZ66_9PELO|nr:unnamed protein product [Caenorhabditis auriculariae]